MPRLSYSERRNEIIAAAQRVMRRRKTRYVSAREVAIECEVETSESTVRRYFHTLGELRDEAIKGMNNLDAER